MALNLLLVATPDDDQYKIAGCISHQGRLLADQNITITIAGTTFSEIVREINGFTKIYFVVSKVDLDNNLRTTIVYKEARTPYEKECTTTGHGIFFKDEKSARPNQLSHHGLTT